MTTRVGGGTRECGESAVVLGLSPTGLSVARSLAPRGIRVYGVDSRSWDAGHYSRWIMHDERISHLAEGPQLLAGLLAFGREQPTPPVIFISADKYVDFVAHDRAELEPYFVLTDSMRPSVNSILLDKSTFYRRCAELGVDLPLTFFPQTELDARLAATELRYPAIVKPTKGYLVRRLLKGAKLVEVASADDLIHWWSKLKEWGSPSVVQECIIGPERNIAVAGLYMNRNHECLSVFTARKARQYPPMYGSASYAEACWLPEIADKSVALMSALEYHGICGTEYKWDDRDAKWKMVEVNCRPVQWFALTAEAGVDIVWDAYNDLRGTPNPGTYGCQDDKARWQVIVRDLPSALHFLMAKELSVREFISTVFGVRRKVEGLFAWDDWPGNWGYLVDTFARVRMLLGNKNEE